MGKRNKCKLCSRTFANGRALGGHMKAHLATLPLPPKPAAAAAALTQQQLGGADDGESESSTYSSSSGEEQEMLKTSKSQELLLEEKGLGYGLRENPKRSFRVADPEFSFAVDAGSSVVQDRESETESSRNPTRRRSKRTRKSGFGESQSSQKQQQQSLDDDDEEDHKKAAKLFKNPSWTESSQAEPEPVSSVSDTSPEEDVAMCLMMLSRDVWMPNTVQEHEENLLSVQERSVEVLDESEELKLIKKARNKSSGGKFSLKV
ncbi:hypothetical protein Tsubulata_048529 [Turnera subulata]|uniref:C2H2-type domain-containing protein n=1 Tax=Turnera subulata TaxID=218843 RepID=A0A9Q0FPQ7_9ROSI|nr:hypothetical protein Tsubulata_048529 [Turnera subulata]